MSDLNQRLEHLTPQQRALLELRMKQRAKPAQPSAPKADPSQESAPTGPTKMDFTLFFFSDDGTANLNDKYGTLMEAAKFADTHGFKAIWTPERHFQTFGGLYPNPAVLNAALAMVTENVRLRAGSTVLPLHGPVRAAEDWALVDNLSKGRVDVSVASGWHKFDYVMAPDRYLERRALMYQHIDTIRRLWRGEKVSLPGVDGENVTIVTYPRPIQKELPIWFSCNSPSTWVRAGEMGGNTLAGVLVSLDDVAAQIKNYRRARGEHGHNPKTGIVSLMLHTYVGESNDDVYEKVREPLAQYLKNFLDQFRMFMDDEMNTHIKNEEDLLAFAVERYFANSSLLGTHEKNAAMVRRLGTIGVNEIACLVDFGMPRKELMEGLERLDKLRQEFV